MKTGTKRKTEKKKIMNDPAKTPTHGILRLVKRTQPFCPPKPVFVDNAKGDLRQIDTSTAKKLGAESARDILKALSSGKHGPI